MFLHRKDLSVLVNFVRGKDTEIFGEMGLKKRLAV